MGHQKTNDISLFLRITHLRNSQNSMKPHSLEDESITDRHRFFHPIQVLSAQTCYVQKHSQLLLHLQIELTMFSQENQLLAMENVFPHNNTSTFIRMYMKQWGRSLILSGGRSQNSNQYQDPSLFSLESKILEPNY